MRRKPRQTRGRVDRSAAKLPPVVAVTPTLALGQLVLTADTPIVLNLPPDLTAPSDINIFTGGSVTQGTPISATQINPFSVGCNFGGSITAGSTLTIGPNMRGIRSNLGGQLVLAKHTF